MADLDPTASFENLDYRDHFIVSPGQPFDSIDDFMSRFALNQPAWLVRLSTGTSGREKLEQAVASLNGGDNPAIGNWKLIERTANAVTVSDNMRILRYRLIFTLTSPNEASGQTNVVYQVPVLGALYWRLTAPVHQRLLQKMLRNAGGPGSSSTDASTVA